MKLKDISKKLMEKYHDQGMDYEDIVSFLYSTLDEYVRKLITYELCDGTDAELSYCPIIDRNNRVRELLDKHTENMSDDYTQEGFQDMTNSNKLQELIKSVEKKATEQGFIQHEVWCVYYDSMDCDCDINGRNKKLKQFLHQVILETVAYGHENLLEQVEVVIGEDEEGYIDSWGEYHNVTTDYERTRNELRAEQRARLSQLVDSLKEKK